MTIVVLLLRRSSEFQGINCDINIAALYSVHIANRFYICERVLSHYELCSWLKAVHCTVYIYKAGE